MKIRAYAVVSSKGGITKLAITKESADRKCARIALEWVNNPPVVKALVFAEDIPAEKITHEMAEAVAIAYQRGVEAGKKEGGTK